MSHPLFDGLSGPALVSTQWLAEHLGAEGLVVLDDTAVRVDGFNGAAAYVSGEGRYLLEGHIPGAVFADLFEDFSDPEGELAFTRPNARHLERAAQSRGIDNDTAVVVYDAGDGSWAARLWWLFRSVGFEVRVLDGGLAKWRAEGRPLATGGVRPRRAGEFSAHADEDAWADKDEVAAAVAGETAAALLCALPAVEFRGGGGPGLRTGHIPGSINAPVSELIDPATNAYLPAEQLRETLGEVIERDAPVIVYCRSGIASASAALALTLLGHEEVRVYDASLSEWAADARAPLATGAQQLAASGGVRHLTQPE